MDFIKVKNHTHLIRDSKTNSIINTNMTEYNEYISKRNAKLEENQKIENLEKDLNNIKDDLNEIKFILKKFIEKSN